MRAATWWIDRWRKSTAYTDMTLAEQGAYRNLLDELWLRESPLPDDDRILGRISGDPVEWPRVRERVMARFTRTPEGWVNQTQVEVFSASLERQRSMSDRGRNAALVRWGSKPPGENMLEHVPEHMLEECPPVSGLREKRIRLPTPPVPPEAGKEALNGISLESINEISLEVLRLWNSAADWVRERNPKGRKWARHWSIPQRVAGSIREHVRRLGREGFLGQLKDLLRWAIRNPFWTELRHDGDSSDRWVPTLVTVLDPAKWDERVEVAIAGNENHRTLDQVSADESEREAAADAELQRILDLEGEKIRRRDEMAGGDSNARFAVEDPTANNDPDIISVVEAAEELIQKRHRRNGASS